MMILTYALLGLLIVCGWLLHSEIKHSERMADALRDVSGELGANGEVSGPTAARILALIKEIDR